MLGGVKLKLSSTSWNGGNRNDLRWESVGGGTRTGVGRKEGKKRNKIGVVKKKKTKSKVKKKKDIFKNQSLVVDKFSKTSTWHHSNKQRGEE